MTEIVSVPTRYSLPALTDNVFASVGSALRRVSLQMLGAAVGFISGGTSPQGRTMQEKLREMHVSVMDFGATRSSTNSPPSVASDTAFNNALAWVANSSSLAAYVNVPRGRFRLNDPLDLPTGTGLVGNGSAATIIHCFAGDALYTKYKTGTQTSAMAPGCITLAFGVNDRGARFPLRKIHFLYQGTSTRSTLHGLYITHKTIMDDTIWDGFPGDGGYFESSESTDIGQSAPTWSVFFGKITRTIFQNNVGNGLTQQHGANACNFWNCIYRNNGRHGFSHEVGGYGSVHIGDTAYGNGVYGINMAAGTDQQMYGCSAYGNTGTDDVYITNNMLRSWFAFTRLTATNRVRLYNDTAWGGSSAFTSGNSGSIQVWWGGNHGYGTNTPFV